MKMLFSGVTEQRYTMLSGKSRIGKEDNNMKKNNGSFVVISAILLLIISVVSVSQAKPLWNGTIIHLQVNDCNGYIIRPDVELYPKGSRPWLWFSPELGNNPHTNRGWIFNNLLRQGWTIAAFNIGESRGEYAGRAKYTDFYNYLMKCDYGLEPKANLFNQSRGGLMHYSWAADNPKLVRSIGAIYPVGDLRSYPKLVNAAKVYNMTVEELTANLSKFNPIDRLAPLAEANIPILHLSGDVDKAVPLEQNSAEVKRRYDKLGGNMRLIVVPGKGHEVIPEFFESADLYNFFYEKAHLNLIKNASKIVDCNVPLQVKAGDVFEVVATLRNEGTKSWTAADGYFLTAVDDSVGADVAAGLQMQNQVAPGKTAKFNIQMTAPKDKQVYEHRFQMSQKGFGTFGQIIHVKVNVINK